MVRKSLEINPELKAGDSTTRFLKKLRERSGAAPTAQAAPAGGLKVTDDTRARTVELFMRQKKADFEREMLEWKAQEAELLERRSAIRRRSLAEVVDLVTLVFASGGSLTPDLLKPHRTFLLELGSSEGDVLKQLRRR
jgi:hypothetical protein